MVHLESRGLDMARLARAKAIGRHDPVQALAYATARGYERQAAVLKGAISAVGVEDAAALISPIATDFAAALAPLTVVGRVPGFRPTLFETRLLSSNTLPAADWTGDGRPIPVAEGDFETVPLMKRTQVSAASIITLELARSSAPKADLVLASELVRGVAARIDVDFLDIANAGEVGLRPASITFGQPSTSLAGSLVAEIDAGLAWAIRSLVNHGTPLLQPAWILNPIDAAALALKRGASGAPAYPLIGAKGGSLLGIPVYVSASIAGVDLSSGRTITLLDADSVEVADEGEADVDISGQAAVRMDSSPTGGATVLVSLWQRNLVGLKTSRTINWRVRRYGAVATLTNVSL